MENILSKVNIIGVLILNKQGEVLFSNSIAKKYNYYFDTIVESTLKGAESFSLINYPAEITTFINNKQLVVLINPMNELVRLKKEKESLQALRKELNEVINSSFDGIVICDKDGIIIHQNPSYEQITGLSAKNCIGRSLKELEDEGIIDVSASLKALRDNKEVTIIQKISTGATVLVSAAPIRNNKGEIEKVVNNVRDLTHLNALESEIQQLEQQNQQIHEELELLKEQNDPKLSIIAQSDIMKDVLDRALRVAHIDSGVLIQGASGVGKEKVVELIHRHSFRKDYPLIKINCGAIPEALLESELFGYESGSFTGANQKGKAGLFEAANHGTIFLDEIGEMPLLLQVKLLRVLQEHEITRVGGTKPIPVDIRIIAATHRDLSKMITNGQFREDLYYRLNVIPIKIPSLKERKADIIPLIYHFLNTINHKYGINRKFSNDTLNAFINYDWPGNVRELQNLIERIALMSLNPEINIDDLQKELQFNDGFQFNVNTSSSDSSSDSQDLDSLKNRVESYETEIIRNAIDRFPSIRKAATALKVDQSTLVRKMQKYKIDKTE
ncbi:MULTISPECIES: sigma-54 interaction domain-containing protein [unclassified Peribacillus]|uniref:sigma-54 interaction domain-containing protein n=1 Tax=unclassified Peribacillus TaxID=2675266 RepID=UPI001F4DEF10|nr:MULTISPECIES: sigma 54-interacting transcriptional regulator [unclassified Peribacillus]MCK1986026.1 sigma 54-interacting transcriptional regulator [Peribacillus sp. Aquil_B1]MCK2011249.1 sigma 54-interacting transcriptional regulator [Peribacillus sp. Aquil_B8]